MTASPTESESRESRLEETKVQPQEKMPEEGKPRVPHGRVDGPVKTPGAEVVEAARRVPPNPERKD